MQLEFTRPHEAKPRPGRGVVVYAYGMAMLLVASLLAACTPSTSTDASPASDSAASTPTEPVVPVDVTSITAHDHAMACAEALGPVPEFTFATGIEIPVEQNGVPVGGGEVVECDLPAAFQDPCGTGLLGRFQGTRADGSANPDVVWTYIVRSGGFAAIGYHAVSGATCFLEIDDLPQGVMTLDAPDAMTPETYNARWTSPQEMFEVSRCQDCHMADPFLHSPYIDQVRDPANPDEPLIPVVAGANNPRPPYEVINSPTAPYTTDLPNNSCTSCHQPQCTTLFDDGDAYKLDELAMPAPFHDLTTWNDAAAVADREEVRAWCNTLSPFGPQFGGGGDDEDDGDEGDEDEGPCDDAYTCALACGGNDYDCAQACGTKHLQGAAASAFAALVTCAEGAGCEPVDLECLDPACDAELMAFIEGCGGED